MKPRFQALPGPKPVLGLGRLGPAPPLGGRRGGGLRLACRLRSGVFPACAALGTQGVERVADALRGCPRVFLAFDNDDAGREATERLLTLLGRRAAAVTLPQGVGDVADLATHTARTYCRFPPPPGAGGPLRPLAAPRRSHFGLRGPPFTHTHFHHAGPSLDLRSGEHLCPIHDELRPVLDTGASPAHGFPLRNPHRLIRYRNKIHVRSIRNV